MGYNGGAEVLDAAIDAAMALITATPRVLQKLQDDPIGRLRLDDTLRPFVKVVADALNDADWDTWDESKYFDRFPQEILGHEDDEHLEWLEEQASYFEAGSTWHKELDAFKERMAVKHGHGWIG